MESVSFGDYNHGLQVGHNSGSIHTKIHLPPERPETPPSPLSTVPFPRDPEFVSRDTLLHQIHEKASVPGGGSRMALVGLGGVGKSQIAIEYSYQVRSKSPATWVFWVHASNEARFEQSFRDIADQLKIYGRQDPKINIFKLVENKLRGEKLGKWVCILDNVDDDKFLCSLSTARKEDPTIGPTNGSTKKPLLEYVPRSQNGSIIITSRSGEVASKMVDHEDLIKVEPMEKSESLELLRRKLNQPEESQACLQLVEALEFIPLAIIQAASYIRNRAPRYSVSQYLADFEGSDRKATRLLEKEAGHLSRDWEAKNSILVTWQISFDHLRQTNPSAADLLSFMSLFDRQGIPEGLIRLRPKAKCTSNSEVFDGCSDGETSESDGDPEFEDDVTTLRNYSFVSVSKNNSFFTMHRLVQLTTRAWLKSHGQLDQWKDRFISILCNEFPTGAYENWEMCRPLFPHVKSAMSQRPASPQFLRLWATLLYRGAWYASQSGKFADAREMASKSREQRRYLLGDDHIEVITSTNMLATAYSLDGMWEEAMQLQVQVTEALKTKLGEGHPFTLMGMHNLASTYRQQGRWKEAEQLFLQVIESLRTKLGEDHPSTLTSMHNLALTYRNQGRWKEAEKFLVHVIEIWKAKLGADHPNTLTSMDNLALTYQSQGRWKEAEELYVQVMETSKTKLGDDHPSTLTNMHNLALTYQNQGRWEEAEQLFVQVMETSRTKLSEGHSDTLSSMHNLASTYRQQGRWEEAEQLLVHVIEIWKAKLGADHPNTLTSMDNLALTYQSQGRWKEAEEVFVHLIETSRANLGDDHPDTLTSMQNLASTYRQQGRWKEAEQLFAQVIETSRTKLGEDHPSTLTSMHNLASTFRQQGRWEEAEQLFVHVMKIWEEKLGKHHPSTMISMHNLALTYQNQGRWEDAEKLNVQVMETRRRKLGEDHPDTLLGMSNLALTWKSLGKDAQAIELLRNCWTKQRQRIGLNHPHTLSNSRTLLLWETDNLNITS